MEQIYKNLISNLKKFFKKSWFSKWVIWLSWWVDSAVTLKLAVDAIWKENIKAIMMPEDKFSSEENLNDAINFAKKIWIKYEIVNISNFIKQFESLPWWNNEISDMNIRARIRMCILYHYANKNNAIVLWTWNKTEIILGYWTKYWDFWVDVEVIWNLYKTQVWEIAKYMKLPEIFITKKPSAELKTWHTDEDEIGFSYNEIDILINKINSWSKIEKKYKPVLDRIKRNKHKTKKIPVINIY